jgi:hypothetical protein
MDGKENKRKNELCMDGQKIKLFLSVSDDRHRRKLYGRKCSLTVNLFQAVNIR